MSVKKNDKTGAGAAAFHYYFEIKIPHSKERSSAAVHMCIRGFNSSSFAPEDDFYERVCRARSEMCT